MLVFRFFSRVGVEPDTERLIEVLSDIRLPLMALTGASYIHDGPSLLVTLR
jgi:hypothetical protein